MLESMYNVLTIVFNTCHIVVLQVWPMLQSGRQLVPMWCKLYPENWGPRPRGYSRVYIMAWVEDVGLYLVVSWSINTVS